VYTNTWDGDTVVGGSSTLTSPTGRVNNVALDTWGRPTTVTSPGLTDTEVYYYPNGQVEHVAQGLRQVAYTYNGNGLLSDVTGPLQAMTPNLGPTHYDYDLPTRTVTQTQPDGRQIVYSFDVNGNLTSLTPPSRPAHLESYTSNDLLETYVGPLAESVTPTTAYAYDRAGRLLSLTRPDLGQIVLTYDSSTPSTGQILALDYPEGSRTYAYDPATKHLSAIDTSDGQFLDFDYDGALLTDVTWSGTVAGHLEVGYDNQFRVSSLQVNGGEIIEYQYENGVEEDGLLTQAGAETVTRDPVSGAVSDTTLGMVRLKVKGTVEDLTKLFEDMFKRVGTDNPKLEGFGSKEAEDEIDKLFG
jgi:YD repeat-containing protein